MNDHTIWLIVFIVFAIIGIIVILRESDDSNKSTNLKPEPFQLSEKGEGFYYCGNCEYNSGSYLICPTCGRKTVVGHSFKMGDGLEALGGWFQLKTIIPPDTSKVKFHICGQGDLGEPLVVTLERLDDSTSYWQTITAERRIKMTGDSGEIGGIIVPIEDFGAQNPVSIRANFVGAEVNEIELSFL